MSERRADLRHRRRLAPVLVLALVLAFIPGLRAQSDARYFPETGQYLGGMFRVFWESNGGVANFGFPITPEYVDPQTERITQYFERARFELGSLNGEPVVTLGPLGVEFTQGRIFPKVPPIENTPDRRYIPETQHIIQYGFKEIWETRGAERIFGYPISEEIKEVLEDGQWRTVQYFQNARFEYWPQFAPGQRVLISTLGRRLAPPELTVPLPPGQPPAGPLPPGAVPGVPTLPQAPAPPPLPASVNATVTPESGPPGTVFQFTATGFEPGEPVGVWLTAPDQSTFGADFQATADSSGSIAGEEIGIRTDESFPDGIWSFNARGTRSGNEAIGYFRIDRVSGLPAGDPNKLGMLIHDELPVQGEALVFPLAGPAGTPFVFLGAGYERDEEVSSWITGPDGTSTPIDPGQVEVTEAGIAQVQFLSSGLADGNYTVVAQGVESGVLNAAAFRITRDFVAGPGTAQPASNNGNATPPQGGAGTTFLIRGQNLAPNEELEFWVTEPTGTYTLFPDRPRADSQGRIGYEPPFDLTVTEEAVPGVYGFHFRGVSSGARVDVYLTVVGSAQAREAGSGALFAQQLGERLMAR